MGSKPNDASAAAAAATSAPSTANVEPPAPSPPPLPLPLPRVVFAVTGFGPFAEISDNPSQKVVEGLRQRATAERAEGGRFSLARSLVKTAVLRVSAADVERWVRVDLEDAARAVAAAAAAATAMAAATATDAAPSASPSSSHLPPLPSDLHGRAASAAARLGHWDSVKAALSALPLTHGGSCAGLMPAAAAAGEAEAAAADAPVFALPLALAPPGRG